MIAAIAASIGLAVGPRPADAAGAAFDARMAASAKAAERLQGDLDGRWTLFDEAGRPLFVLQISDPPGGAAPLEAGWRLARGAAMGPVETITRAGRGLDLDFQVEGRAMRLRLRRAGPALWRGWMIAPGSRRRVRLSR